MPVRCYRIECIVPTERKQAYFELSVACQRMLNRLWQIWLCHHANAGSADKLRRHFVEYRQWQRTKAGTKPAWPCKCIEPPLNKSADANSLYRLISKEFPEVNVRTRGLLTNSWQSLLSSRKAASGALPGWVSILFANESIPSFTRPQPIPFDKQNAKLELGEDGTVFAVVRIDRDIVSGKSTVDRLALMLNKRKARNARVVVERVLSGEYAWKGSDIVYDRGKWYAAISYEIPAESQKKPLDKNKIMYVRPGRYKPWRVAVSGSRSFSYGGYGDHVTIARKRIEGERASRMSGYKWAGSTRKGRGRSRAESVWTKLSDRWKDFVKRYNREMANKIVRLAIEKGCGRVVYLQPTGKIKDSRALTRMGATDRSRTSWDYFQMGHLLASKCEQLGVEFGKAKKTQEKKKPGRAKKTGARKSAELANKNKAEKRVP